MTALTRRVGALHSPQIPDPCAQNQAPTETPTQEAPMPAAQIPVVKPDRPMTLADVDQRLQGCVMALGNARLIRLNGAAADADLFRERVMLDADRLLDVRLAIMVDGEA